MRLAVFVGLCAAVAACGDPAASPVTVPGEILGRVEISADVPASGCRALLEGSPLGAPCDESGAFDIRGVPPGRWDVRIVNDDPLALPGKRVAAGANSGFVTDLGAIRLAQPGAIGGRVINGEVAGAIVALPAYGVVTAPNVNGGYLLQDVPPGVHDVVLIAPDGTVVHADVGVAPDKVTIGVDLDYAVLSSEIGPIVGRAIRGDNVEGGDSGLTVELIDALTGEVVASVETDSDGGFELPGSPGVFAVRARDGDSPITAIVPAVVPHDELPLTLPSPLVVFPMGGDLDADGVPDADDPDADGDGVANASDAFPFDPAESADVDGDGLGDRADLATQGDDVDTHNDTPDDDGDGLFDFEDVCPDVADPDQEDVDGDGDGDVCDNCPTTPNEDQQDSVGDGVGDVCRACDGSEDCPDDLICQQGRCVGCVTSSQCGDQVCDDGQCVACTAELTCGGERVCNLSLGVCQECLVDLDCDAGAACIGGHCFVECTTDAECPGGFCSGGACVACRDNADCSSEQWCDSGLCADGCSTDAACTLGRVCDLATRTCVLPCDAMCPTGQTCDDGGICRQLCDGSFPCTGGLECDPVESYCVPSCSVDVDCGQFEVCQLGQCVPSGGCAYDHDCGPSQMCGFTGTCIARPTSFDPVAGAYTCSGACDCKMGEACSAGHCIPEGVPTRFVVGGGTGDGSAPDVAMGDLSAAMVGMQPGDVVALRASTTITENNLVEVPAGVTVQGGYLQCSATRWARDAADTTSTRVESNYGVLRVTGTFGAQRPGVVIRAMTLEALIGGWTLVDADYAPGLRVEDITVEVAAGTATNTGVRCTNCVGVTIDRISAPSIIGYGTTDVVELVRSSGLVRDVEADQILDGNVTHAVRVTDASGPVTVEGTRSGVWSPYMTSSGVLVEDTTFNAITVTGGTHGWFTGWSTSGGLASQTMSAIHARNCDQVVITDNLMESPAFLDPFPTPQHLAHVGVWVENSDATVADNTVVMPRVSSSTYVIPYQVTGPEAVVTMTDNDASGLGGQQLRFISVTGIVTGAVTIDGGTFTSAQNLGAATAYGLHVTGSRVTATDLSFEVAGEAVTTAGLFVDASANVRVERSRFVARGETGTNDNAYGGVISNSNVELYGSWFVGAGPSDVRSAALFVNGGVTLRAIGNTLDGDGTATQAGESVGLVCGPAANTSMLFRSNLIDGGDAAVHRMFVDPSVRCGGPTAFDHNYFSYGGPGGRSAGDNVATVATAAVGVADATFDIVGDATGCFDPGFFAPDFHIATGSPCVNAGVAGTRIDGSAITQDLLGGSRTLGASADIGAHEVQ